MRKYLLFFLLTACANPGEPDYTDHRTPTEQELSARVLSLQGLLSQIQSFLASEYTDCAATLPAFEQKICQIAQTSTAEQQVLLSSQLATVAKTFQTTLYGPDCSEVPSPGCPAAGSVLASLTDHEADLAALEASLNAIESRMTSAESAIAAAQASLSTLAARVTAVESVLASSSIYRMVQICANVSPTVGPIFETVLLQGDSSRVTAYLEVSGNRGLGNVKVAGGGDEAYQTTLSNLQCRFAIYDLGLVSGLRICWKTNDRNANLATISAACGRVGGPSGGTLLPGPQCTCYGGN